jgi:hypothetical protein
MAAVRRRVNRSMAGLGRRAVVGCLRATAIHMPGRGPVDRRLFLTIKLDGIDQS